MNHRQAYHHEEIGHLTDWHRICTVTHDAEDTEESQSDTHRSLTAVHTHHEVHQEEDGHRYDYKGEVEVAPMTLLVVQEVDNDPVDEETDKEPHNSFTEACRKHFVHIAHKFLVRITFYHIVPTSLLTSISLRLKRFTRSSLLVNADPMQYFEKP